jgi:hypothetical protein
MADVKVGSSDPSTFYFGASAVSKLYQGSTEVWSSAGETVLDTYSSGGNEWRWRSTNTWWNRLNQGTWSSTGTLTGTYLAIDSGSRVGTSSLMFSALDPGGWPADSRVRLTVTPSSGGPAYALEGTPAGAGDSRWYWRDSDGNALILTTAQIEAGGTFGWDQADSFTIEIFTP